jgi:holo-[acyl-carrier protein] synthase
MIYTGIDLIEIARVERAARRWGARFLQRVFVPGELADCGLAEGAGPAARWPSLAARWAAKEAAAKALGVGLRGLGAGQALGVALREIEVRRDAGGRPLLALHGAAARRAAALGIGELAVSLSHSGGYAVASVVALAP